MSDDPTEALELLNSLASPASQTTGIEMVSLSSVGIFLSPVDLAKNPKLRALRWPQFTRDAAGIEAWQQCSLAVHAEQERTKPKTDTAKPASERPMPIRIVRV